MKKWKKRCNRQAKRNHNKYRFWLVDIQYVYSWPDTVFQGNDPTDYLKGGVDIERFKEEYLGQFDLPREIVLNEFDANAVLPKARRSGRLWP